MNLIDQQKPSFTMEIPYIRVDGMYPFNKTEVKDVKTLTFESTGLGVTSKILRMISLLPNDLVGGVKHEAANNLMRKHEGPVIEIIALSVQNNNKLPDPALSSFIRENFNSQQMAEALNYVMICLGLDDIIVSMMTIKPRAVDSIDAAIERLLEVKKGLC